MFNRFSGIQALFNKALNSTKVAYKLALWMAGNLVWLKLGGSSKYTLSPAQIEKIQNLKAIDGDAA
mgnify:CR=1 FL=1